MATVDMAPGGPTKEVSMQYMESVRFPTDNEKWVNNLLWGSLCMLSTSVIPIVGQLIWMGYMFEIVERLHTHRSEPYQEFTLDKLVDYLMRGVWRS